MNTDFQLKFGWNSDSDDGNGYSTAEQDESPMDEMDVGRGRGHMCVRKHKNELYGFCIN